MRPKTILVLVLVLAGAAAVVFPSIRKHRAESAANDRREQDEAIDHAYKQLWKPLLKIEAKEPARVIGKVLPVAVKNSMPPELDASLDKTLYTELAPELRADRLADAGTIAFVDREGTAFYTGGETGVATVATGLTVTLFDPATKTVLGTKHFDGGELPQETDKAGLDNVSARQAARIAAYLKTLPH